MNGRDDLLRGAVYAACAERDANGGKVSCTTVERVIFVHRIWPLIVYERAIERAQARAATIAAERATEITDLVALLRSTYPKGAKS